MNKGSIWNKSKYLICWLFAISSCVLIATEAFAGSTNNLEYRVNYCQAKTAPATIEQATQCNYQPSYTPLSSGLAESPRWIRIQISDDQIDGNSIAIQIGPYFLKRIEFFQYTSKGWISEKAGSRYANGSSNSDIGGALLYCTPYSTKSKYLLSQN